MSSEKSNKSKQHVQLNVQHYTNLKPNDLLILANIKRYMNNKTRKCCPSIKTISEKSGFSERMVITSIHRLELALELIVHRQSQGLPNIYEFPKDSEFEMYSFEFLDNPNLTKDEKAYLIGFQSCAVKNKAGFMRTTYTNEQIGKMINLSRRKITEINKSLKEKGIYAELSCISKDEAGLNRMMKMVDMKLIGQAIVILHERVQKNTNDIAEIKQQLDEVIRLNKAYIRENRRLLKEVELLKNSQEVVPLEINI